jgi:hypothetical protein
MDLPPGFEIARAGPPRTYRYGMSLLQIADAVNREFLALRYAAATKERPAELTGTAGTAVESLESPVPRGSASWDVLVSYRDNRIKDDFQSPKRLSKVWSGGIPAPFFEFIVR